jgi:hypothetical protein
MEGPQYATHAQFPHPVSGGCMRKANQHSKFKRIDLKLRSEARCSYVTGKQSFAHCEDSIASSLCHLQY